MPSLALADADGAAADAGAPPAATVAPVVAPVVAATAPVADHPTVSSPTHLAANAEPQAAIALAVNPPLRWGDGDAVGVSGYLGLTSHHALRFNYATHKEHGDAFGVAVGDAFFGGDGTDAIYTGRVTDLGVAWQWFPRALFDGASFEGGLVRRSIDTSVDDDNAPVAIVKTNGTGYAARALVGWSWLFSDTVFVAVAAGGSVGRYAGTETTSKSDTDVMYTSKDYARVQGELEGYIRLGVKLGW